MAIDSADHQQIGEVAERLGLSLRTIRYYEEMGLVEPSQRSPGGFRLYSEDDVERLELVRSMKPLGLSLETMKALLEARERLAAASDPEALERLSEVAGQAREETARLRSQLAAAEQFARRLDSEVRKHRRRARESPA